MVGYGGDVIHVVIGYGWLNKGYHFGSMVQ
jgi:hypothetical protein